jgi:hypothetical protein
MSARAIDINDGEDKVICPEGESRSDGELIDRLVNELQHRVVPSSKDPA